MKKIALLSLLFLLNFTFILAQWEDDVRISSGESNASLHLRMGHSIVASGDTVHITWMGNKDGNFEIYYRRSVDAGKSWEMEKRLTNYPDSSRHPMLAISGNYVYIFFVDKRDSSFNIYLLVSENGGSTWSTEKQLNRTPYPDYLMDAVASGNDIYLSGTYTESEFTYVFFMHSSDNGKSWNSTKEIFKKSKINSSLSSIVVNRQKVLLFWSDVDVTGSHQWMNLSSDKGSTWGSAIEFVSSTNSNYYPRLCNQGDTVFTVWLSNQPGNTELFFTKSSNFGATWSNDYRLTANPGSSIYPNAVFTGNNLYIVWLDNTNSNIELFYKHSSDFLESWSVDTVITDNKGTESSSADIAVSSSVVHVVWTDLRDNPKGQVYYKRNPTGAPTHINEIKPKEGSLIYPVPANDFIQISNCEEPLEYKIMNILGVRIQTGTLVNDKIDVSKLCSGVYFIIFKKQENISTNYFIKK